MKNCTNSIIHVDTTAHNATSNNYCHMGFRITSTYHCQLHTVIHACQNEELPWKLTVYVQPQLYMTIMTMPSFSNLVTTLTMSISWSCVYLLINILLLFTILIIIIDMMWGRVHNTLSLSLWNTANSSPLVLSISPPLTPHTHQISAQACSVLSTMILFKVKKGSLQTTLRHNKNMNRAVERSIENRTK